MARKDRSGAAEVDRDLLVRPPPFKDEAVRAVLDAASTEKGKVCRIRAL